MISERCETTLAKEIVAATTFSSNYKKVERNLLQSAQMVLCLDTYGDFPGSGYVDTMHFLKKIGIEGLYLDATELLELRKSLVLAEEIVAFFGDKEDIGELQALTERLESFKREIRLIGGIIDELGAVKDSASKTLAEIRQELSIKEREAGRRIHAIMRSAQSEGIVEEDVSLSVRDGRLVIPVASALKRKIKGFVHDESATGKTSYVEPIEVVEINNEIRELHSREKREVRRILLAFSSTLTPRVEALRQISNFISYIDFLKAKALVAIKMGAVMPKLVDEPMLELRDARHPLLEQHLRDEGKSIVPLSLHLDKREHILIISGPNAGGKSICLKSVGLLQYMVQCGILPSVLGDSTFGLFESLFIDIGDQQSLDNDLSTYSSHLQNMKSLLKHGDEKSLILIDEFGTGTEPTMGGAIAEAILEKMESKGMFAVITTHYTNLKYYADKSSGVVSGAMTFDVQNITPLFRLEMGKPGSSFALEIARKIGLPEDVISSAKDKIGDGQVFIEKQMREVARDKRYWAVKRDNIRKAERKADELAATYEEELKKLQERRNGLIKEAKREAEGILQGANKLIENTIFEIRESQAEKERTKAARRKVEEYISSEIERQEAGEVDSQKREFIDKKMEQLREREKRRTERKKQRGEEVEQKKVIAPAKPKAFVAGNNVRIKGQNVIGKIHEIQGKSAEVHFGTVTTTIQLAKLEHVDSHKADAAKQEEKNLSNKKVLNSYDTSVKRLNFSQQLDVRGERVNDALLRVQEFIDESYMLGFSEVKILHGKGTGALRQEIKKLLKTMPEVVSTADEHELYGGAGITVVTVRN